MSLYRVRTGYAFGSRNMIGPGDLVDLSAAEALAFADKLEPVDGTPSPAPAEPTGADELPAPWLDFGDLAKHLNMIRLLIANGYATPQAVQAASDEELLAIKGIGPKALGALRAVLGAA